MIKYHYMIDIETMGVAVTAPILSIGAVKFDPDMFWDATPLEGFSVNVDLETCTYGGGIIEPGTLKWWLMPERAAAREELLKGHGVDLRDALDGLKEWMGDGGPIWANSPSFDLAILARAFRVMNTQAPWTHRTERDYRTVFCMAPTKYIEMAKEAIGISFPNLTPHSARDDAEWQVRMLVYLTGMMAVDIK